MLKLKLYKNGDQNQPLDFVGESDDEILATLKTWMNDNNGLDGNPCQVHKLTLAPVGGIKVVMLTRRGFAIDWGIGDNVFHFRKWSEARSAFCDACSYELYPA
jgi:hypothetical protein